MQITVFFSIFTSLFVYRLASAKLSLKSDRQALKQVGGWSELNDIVCSPVHW